MEILKSPAGCEPVIGENVNLDAAKVAMNAAIEEFEEISEKKIMEGLAAIPKDVKGSQRKAEMSRIIQVNAPGAMPGYRHLRSERKWLDFGKTEICCPETGFHIWARTEEDAILLWNKAIEKLPTLEPCCHDVANQNVRRTNAGFPLVRCSVCGRKHVPEKALVDAA